MGVNEYANVKSSPFGNPIFCAKAVKQCRSVKEKSSDSRTFSFQFVESWSEYALAPRQSISVNRAVNYTSTLTTFMTTVSESI